MSRHSQLKLRKYAPRRARSASRAIVLFLAASLVVIVGLAILASASSSAPQVTGSPHIAIVQDTFDYGDVPLGKTVQTVFVIRNTGDKPLIILNQPQVRVAEGCCPPTAMLSSSVIQPGQEALLSMSFVMHDGMGGKHRFLIDLKTNDPTQPLKQLVVLSNWV